MEIINNLWFSRSPYKKMSWNSAALGAFEISEFIYYSEISKIRSRVAASRTPAWANRRLTIGRRDRKYSSAQNGEQVLLHILEHQEIEVSVYDIVFLPSNTEPSVTSLYAHWQAALIPSDAYLPAILLKLMSFLLLIKKAISSSLSIHVRTSCLVRTASLPCSDLIGPLALPMDQQHSRKKEHCQREQTNAFEIKMSSGVRSYRNVLLNSIDQLCYIWIIVSFFCSLYYVDIPYLRRGILISP